MPEYPRSSVPAAFDRGHLYSPTLAQTALSLDDRYAYDYRPGDLFEPMPAAPCEPKAYRRWWRNSAHVTTPDFLGLRPGDTLTVQHVTSVGPGTVLATWRAGAWVEYPYSAPAEYGRTLVRRRNNSGHWY
ncbi:hypothetical protein [Streptomyces sp. NPDC051561]|uniref:hypothetical protein n=1 Tax=Streptomyces sp. NPDC051561 TaxID=3365658 RepID=UPI0037AE6D2E